MKLDWGSPPVLLRKCRVEPGWQVDNEVSPGRSRDAGKRPAIRKPRITHRRQADPQRAATLMTLWVPIVPDQRNAHNTEHS